MAITTRDAVISVRSSSIHLGSVLPARARRGVARIALKYLGRLTGASVYFKREGRSYDCTINIEVGALKIVTGKASGVNCYLALDDALKKAAKQLRRMRRGNDKQFRALKVLSPRARRPLLESHVIVPSSRKGSHAVFAPR